MFSSLFVHFLHYITDSSFCHQKKQTELRDLDMLPLSKIDFPY